MKKQATTATTVITIPADYQIERIKGKISIRHDHHEIAIDTKDLTSQTIAELFNQKLKELNSSITVVAKPSARQSQKSKNTTKRL